MVCMKNITLLGDSIIDNKYYVQQGELSVLEHLRQISNHEFTQIARDGDTTHEVLNGQLLSLENTASHIVISIGGNDLLTEINFLNPTAIVNQIGNVKFLKGRIYSPDSPEYFEEKYEIWRLNKEIYELKKEVNVLNKQIHSESQKNTNNNVFKSAQNKIFKPLEQRFETIVEKLSYYRANLLLLTVYEGDLGRTDEFRGVLDSSKIMVSSFNDIVYKTAKKYGADVLELRHIFTSSEDYANPIEPSHIGGEKLAKAITEWVDAT